METRARRAPRPLQGLTRPSGFLVVTIAAALLASTAHAQKKEYSYEDNPVRLGLAALHQGKWAEAKAHLEEAVQNDVDPPHAHWGLAVVAARQGDDAAADSLFQLAINEQKGGAFPEAHAERALLLMRLDKDEAAAAEIGQALKEDKNRWDVQFAKEIGRAHV